MELTPPPSKDATKKSVFFENPDMDYMAQHFVGNLNRYVLPFSFNSCRIYKSLKFE